MLSCRLVKSVRRLIFLPRIPISISIIDGLLWRMHRYLIVSSRQIWDVINADSVSTFVGVCFRASFFLVFVNIWIIWIVWVRISTFTFKICLTVLIIIVTCLSELMNPICSQRLIYILKFDYIIVYVGRWVRPIFHCYFSSRLIVVVRFRVCLISEKYDLFCLFLIWIFKFYAFFLQSR